MVFGKLIAGVIGLLTGGLPGLIIGLIVGHFFDRALAQNFGSLSADNLARMQESFFEATFLLSGYLAKADGRVSEAEIAHTEQLFVQMGLNGEQRKQAIELFRRGAEPDFEASPVVQRFVQSAGRQRQLTHMLLLFLISLGHADQQLTPQEHAVLLRIAQELGMGAAQFERLLAMARAQGRFHGGDSAPSQGDRVQEAYEALGVDSSVSDANLKRAYRKLMSENHPDKLIARGVPEEMLKLGTERAQDIQAAYEILRKHRGMKT